MLEKLAGIHARFNEIERLMVDPSILADFEQVAKLAKERSDLQPIIEQYHLYLAAQQQLNDAKEMLKDADPDIRDLAQVELDEAKERIPLIEEALKVMLLPKDPRCYSPFQPVGSPYRRRTSHCRRLSVHVQ